MEILAVLLFFIILFLVNSLNRNISKRFTALELEIRRLTEKISHPEVKEVPENIVVAAIVPLPEKEVKKEDKWESGFKPMQEPFDILPPQEPIKEIEEIAESAIPFREPIPTFSTPEDKQPYVNQHIEERPGFFERHPDLEKFIGENLVSKIGIAILVLAIGFFVKYAIDNNWIAPVGRVAIGILCGGILATIGHRLRNSYTAFSSVMVGGALAVFYFTITLAYHQFHLFSQTVSFIIMIVITGFAVLLSLLYNRQELAIIALVGGFATPFMVSNGSGNYQALFTYLIILNIGLLIISYNKAWRILNILAFAFTVLIFSIWIFSLPGNTTAITYRNGFLFATVFYLLFFIINIAHNIKENKKFIASDFGILLANTCLYFSAGLYLIKTMKADDYSGLFSLAIGSFNLLASYFLFRSQKADKNILYLLIGLTLTFISLTAPIQLHGNHITIFWASETVLLYWLFQKSKISIIRIASIIIWAAMMVSLIMDWAIVYVDESNILPIIANKGFITTLYCSIANYALFLLKRKDIASKETDILSHLFQNENIFRILSVTLLFLAGFFEINYQFTRLYPSSDINNIYILLYIFSFVLLFIAITNRVKSLNLTTGFKFILLSLCLTFHLIFSSSYFYIQQRIIQEASHSHFIAHWIGALLIAVIIYQLIRIANSENDFFAKSKTVITWAICTAVVVYLSVEAHLLVNEIFFSKENTLANISRVFIKTGLPILWGVCSFAFMWLGMKYKSRLLRIISLTLFSITLLKLFIFDIRDIPAAGKIAAFFCLGILLLIVSFMYQRLKKIIIEDEKNATQ